MASEDVAPCERGHDVMMKPYPTGLLSLLTVLTSLLVMLVNVTDPASVLRLVGAVEWSSIILL